MNTDYQTLTDNELNELFQQIYDEQARRRNMRELPEQVVGLVSAYEQLGGDKQEIIDRINVV
ncbi:MAG TPA: hypothetical protein PKD19_04420 [Candidatus Saccharibacteria bacterium]|jgi:hypothetical protein|nr:hypothetical protein [Candidatus Saccharibacteria bacterium]